ncbi:Uncharacterised protein [Mycobacteroides abscessus subsp. abscessus]|nr:Uncharacterised protein [Mycobacteroides abscessus subsp. abscessus]
MEEEIGVRGLFERRPERLDELVGKVADESDGIGVGERDAVGGPGLSNRRVEGREQGVLDHHLGVGEPVEQGRFAGVRIADDRHGGHMVACAVLPLRVPGGSHAGDLAAQLRHPSADAAPVEFDLRLTGTT